jgi:hypothetical protein
MEKNSFYIWLRRQDFGVVKGKAKVIFGLEKKEGVLSPELCDIRRGEFKLIKLPVETFDGKNFIVYHKTRPLPPITQDFINLLRSREPRDD